MQGGVVSYAKPPVNRSATGVGITADAVIDTQDGGTVRTRGEVR